MKKTYILITILSLLLTGLVSCGDYTDFSTPHTLTDVEIAEMARLDSIAKALRNNITANLILEYSVNFPASATAYDGTNLTIDLDRIAKTFGITKAQLIAGIQGTAGAPAVAGFAIEGSTHADNTNPTTAGSEWGHWWDKNGDVTNWGKTAVVFTEFHPADSIFVIGQYPGSLKTGDKIKVIECLKYGDKRVAVVITITAADYVDPETAPTGTPTSVEKNIELTKPYSDDYASVQVDVKDLLRNAFKKTTYEIHQAIESGDLKLYQGAVTTTDPTYTADAPGYWLQADGTAGPYASGLVWCTLGHSRTELFIYGGNHPDNGPAGTIVTTKLIATYNGGTVTFNITFKVTAP